MAHSPNGSTPPDSKGDVSNKSPPDAVVALYTFSIVSRSHPYMKKESLNRYRKNRPTIPKQQSNMAIGRHFAPGNFLDRGVNRVEPVLGFICAGHLFLSISYVFAFGM